MINYENLFSLEITVENKSNNDFKLLFLKEKELKCPEGITLSIKLYSNGIEISYLELFEKLSYNHFFVDGMYYESNESVFLNTCVIPYYRGENIISFIRPIAWFTTTQKRSNEVDMRNEKFELGKNEDENKMNWIEIPCFSGSKQTLHFNINHSTINKVKHKRIV